jgi:ribose 5-phosphate isomerase B
MFWPQTLRPPHPVIRHMAMLHTVRVYLGSDHAGFELKAFLVEHLSSLGHEVVDVGPAVFDPDDDYPPFCFETARRVVADPGSLGVVIGGSGNGEQISANKVAGCRAALAWSTETAQLAREHNDAQVVGIGARMHRPAEAAEIVETFLATPFSGDERHARRIALISEFESTGKYPPVSTS